VDEGCPDDRCLSTEKVWLPEIQILRGIAILAVIAIHTSAYYTTIGQWSPLAVVAFFTDIFFGFAVPLFLFISGFILSIKYYEHYSIKKFYKNRVASVLPPFILFSLIIIALDIVWHGPIPTDQVILRLGLFDAISYYFYIAIILEIYILYPIIIKCYRAFERKGKAVHFVLIMLLIQLTYNFVDFYYISSIVGIGSWYWIIEQRIFLSSFFYFILGIYIWRNYGKFNGWIRSLSWIKVLIPAVTISIIIGALSAFYYNIVSDIKMIIMADAITKPIFCILIFILCFKLTYWIVINSKKANRIMTSVGNFSFGIFLVHGLFQIVISFYLIRFGISSSQIIFFPLLFLGILGCSWFVIFALSLLPGGTLLVGYRTKLKIKRLRKKTENDL
jgi:peptidoglycan/LPS O-acetylase OafA/YrhL